MPSYKFNTAVPVSFAIIILGIIALLFMVSEKPEVSNTVEITLNHDPSHTRELEQSIQPPITVENIWQWESFSNDLEKNERTNTNELASYVDPEKVFNALQAIRLDENGDIITDHQALLALNKAFDHGIEQRINNTALAELTYTIELGLPGKVGRQAADIAEKYYHYLQAENEFNHLNNHADNPLPPELQYEELRSLRALYLGHSLANDLFAVTDANAEYMFRSMALESDNSLGAEEKSVLQEINRVQHEERTVGIENWTERYARFTEAKQQTLAAAISNQEKREQLNALLNEHFTAEELTKIEHLPLGEL